LKVGSPKFFRLSIGNEVRLKMYVSSKQESVVKDSEGITEIHMLLDDASRGGSGEASQRKVAGTLHWVSIKHALKLKFV
jgi:glutaminyl-tRNA synthetase